MSLLTFEQPYKTAAPLVLLVLFLALVVLFLCHPVVYSEVLYFWGIVPYRWPFIDLHYILASVSCWRQGIDVYVSNICDVEHRPYAYSPLWLRATFLPTTEWAKPLGVTLALCFILSLLYLPASRRAREFVLFLLAVISPTVVFALERANADVIMFLFCTGAGISLLFNRARRFLGYALIMTAGLLKFYPLTLLILVVREHLRTAIIIIPVAIGIIYTFVYYYGHELSEMLPNIPVGNYFYDMFGARNLPYGLAEVVSGHWQFVYEYYHPRVLLAFLNVLALAYAVNIGRRPDVQEALAALSQRHLIFLMIGSLLIIGCFLAGQSAGYREIHLLFALPGLLMLSRSGSELKNPPIFFVASIVVILLMWKDFLRRVVKFIAMTVFDASDIPNIVFWLGRELVWWWLIGLLGGLVMVHVTNSRTLLELCTVVASIGHRFLRRRHQNVSRR
jgi:hypothetical protein